MAFSYQGTGTIKLFGCSATSRTYTITYRFAESSIVYLCEKAQKGIIESIWIKSVNLANTEGQYVPVYKDNLNAIYMESELCTQVEATNAAVAYLQSQIDNITNVLNCNV